MIIMNGDENKILLCIRLRLIIPMYDNNNLLSGVEDEKRITFREGTGREEDYF